MAHTAAQLKALEAVRLGKCQRQYTPVGNKLHGAHSKTLSILHAKGLIKDGLKAGNWVTLEITSAGRSLLGEF